MKSARKFISLLMAVTLLLSMVAGAMAEEGVTIRLAIHVANCEEQEPAVYAAIKAFEAANPDVRVELIENASEDHITQMKLWAQTDELPDIFWCTEGDVPEFGNNGFLLGLDEFLSCYPQVDAALSDAIKHCYVNKDGQIIGLPYTALVTGFYYNKAIFDEFGVDYPTDNTTYAQVLDMIEAFSQGGMITFAQGAMTNYSVWGWLDCLIRYGYAENVEALKNCESSSLVFGPLFDKLVEMGQKGAFPANMATIDYFEAKNLFVTGQAAIFTSGQWDAAEIGEALGDDVGFWWGMTFEDSQYTQETINQFANAPFVVSAKVGEDEAKKEAVYRFLAFYFGEEGSAILLENSNMPATNYQGLEADNDNPAFAAISQALSNGNPSVTAANPVATLSTSINEPFYDALNSLMLNNITTEEAVQIIDAAFAEAAQ